ncbi:MAG TPA: chemotaxis protein CheW [Clostridiales bacterium]|nr:chemotaxis protein CheW [Clostridiales bacterium]
MAATQLVLFNLGDDEYGVNILDVQEIIKPQEVTKVPDNPEFIEGIINLRGTVVPIIDLKSRVGLGDTDITDDTRFIILNTDDQTIGFIVDSVKEILRLEEDALKEIPEITKINKDYIDSVVERKGKLIIVFDLKKVLSVQEMDLLKNEVTAE